MKQIENIVAGTVLFGALALQVNPANAQAGPHFLGTAAAFRRGNAGRFQNISLKTVLSSKQAFITTHTVNSLL